LGEGGEVTPEESVMQVARRPAQVVQLDFQLPDHRLEAFEFNPLQGLHALLDAALKPLEHLGPG
jgi:hypothetical protein